MDVFFQRRKNACAPFRLLLAVLFSLLLCCFALSAQAEESVRALLIGMDEFVSKPSASPSSRSTNPDALP